MSVGDVVERHRLVVCVGTGGVGKTTLAASLAVGAAVRGKRAMVLTIDPARALARALGLEALGREGERVDTEALRSAGVTLSGTLSAAMLDQKSAWDGFIARHAPSGAIRRSILENPFYQELSQRFAGATEFVAVEELCRLHESGRYDLIVLDTPPAAHALDFVTAPARIDRFLAPELAGALTEPAELLKRSVSRTVRFLVTRLRRAAGSVALGEISAFFQAFAGLGSEIRHRSERARSLLRGDQTAFVLVVGPDALGQEASAALAGRVRNLELPLRAVIQNRAHPLPGAFAAELEPISNAVFSALRAAGTPAEAVAHMKAVHRDAVRVARAEHFRSRELRQSFGPGVEHATIAELDHDLHALGDLFYIASELGSAP